MKIAVCDDDQKDLREVAGMLRALEQESPLSFELESFTRGDALLRSAGETFYDLIILDIYLEDYNGVQLAGKIREVSPRSALAFISVSRNFAVEAFELGALHYMVKPIGMDQMRELMERFARHSGRSAETVVFPAGRETYEIPQKSILKIISERKGVRIFSTNGRSEWLRLAFMRAEALLDPEMFVRINRGYLVNMNHIRSIRSGVCFLDDGSEILLSRKNSREIRQKYRDFQFRVEQ